MDFPFAQAALDQYHHDGADLFQIPKAAKNLILILRSVRTVAAVPVAV